jgi:lysophospholipase L1-like esterase
MKFTHTKWLRLSLTISAFVYLSYSFWRIYWMFVYGSENYLGSLFSWHSTLWIYSVYILFVFFVIWLFIFYFFETFFSVCFLFSIYLGYRFVTSGYVFKYSFEVIWWYIYPLIFVTTFLFLLKKIKFINSKTHENTVVSSFSFFGVLYIIEIMLRVSSLGEVGSFSFDLNNKKHPHFSNLDTWYYIGNPNDYNRVLQSNEFSYVRKTNSLGFSDIEWVKEKPDNQIRILTLGDSFTEGDGASYEDSYPSILQKMFIEKLPEKDILVMNAGVCGSDPFFQYIILKDILLEYKPDLVIFTIGTNDVFYDFTIFGGMERFKDDGTVQTLAKTDYWWTAIYRNSYFIKFFIQFTPWFYSDLISKRDHEKANNIRNASFSHLYNLFDSLSVAENFSLLQIIRPETFEFKNERYKIELTAFFNELRFNKKKTPATFDLLDYYLKTLKIKGSEMHLFYWKENRHHNTEGYKIMAKGVYEAIISNYEL